MKTLSGFIFGLVLISLASARDFRPEGRVENLPSTDGSVQQCYIFRTVPGIRYRVESSHDLSQWTAEAEIYGLGNEYALAMREFTPPPPPEPGADPPAPEAPATQNASLFIQPSSGAAGGTVVSWASLDQGGPVRCLLSQSMTSGWDQMPLFWDTFGDYGFFILQAAQSIEPPAENPPLEPKDAAMFAQLESSFSAMNEAIDSSVALARNTPPPAPSDPDARKFWRIFCDASVDTDQDGTPDWAEFEMAAQGGGAMVAGVTGNAFNGDTNGDGIPDGQQLDSDGDGTADASDIAPNDNTATYEIGPLPRYAVFPVTNAQPVSGYQSPLQINDQGTVLYANGTWTGGTWTPLQGAAEGGGDGVYVRAFGINDHGEIVGVQTGMRDAQNNPILGDLTYWGVPTAQCAALSVAGSSPWIGGVRYAYPGYILGNYFSNDGRLIGYEEKHNSDADGNLLSNSLEGPYLWTLPGNSRTPGKVAIPLYEGGVLDASHYWGWNWQTVENALELHAGGGDLKPPEDIRNVHVDPTGALIVSFDWDQDTQVYKDGKWQASETYAKAIDVSDDGTAIGKNHDGLTAPILLNGKWTGIEHTAPGLSGNGHNPPVELLDTTPGGWILARRELSDTQTEHSVMVPIRVEGRYETVKIDAQGNETPLDLTVGVGVDDFSIGADSPDPATEDSIWFMAPAGDGATEVTVRAPLNANTPLKLSGFGLLKFGASDDITLTQPEKTFALTAGGTSSGYGVNILTELGEVQPLSHPLRAKVMKRRTVKVTVYKISRKISETGTPIPPEPEIIPTKAELENHLQNLYKPQINVDFTVTMDPHEYAVQWDLADANGRKNGVLDNAANFNEHSPEQQLIYDAVSQGGDANIKVFIVSSEGGLSSQGDAYGMTSRGQRTCWILGSRVLRNKTSAFVMDTIGHEMGHVFVDYGHPDSKKQADQGHAPLPGTKHVQRLMCSGNNSTDESRVLVKGEWDEAEAWLKNEENEGRLP